MWLSAFATVQVSFDWRGGRWGTSKTQFRSQGGRGDWGGLESAHVIFEQPPQTKIDTKEDRNCQIESPFVDSLIQNGYDITWPHQLFPIGSLRREIQKKLRKFGHMSKLGVPYLPCSLVWTKISLDKHSSVYPTYLPKKFGHFGTKVCSWIINFDRNFIAHVFKCLVLCMKKNPQSVFIEIFWHWQKLIFVHTRLRGR